MQVAAPAMRKATISSYCSILRPGHLVLGRIFLLLFGNIPERTLPQVRWLDAAVTARLPPDLEPASADFWRSVRRKAWHAGGRESSKSQGTPGSPWTISVSAVLFRVPTAHGLRGCSFVPSRRLTVFVLRVKILCGRADTVATAQWRASLVVREIYLVRKGRAEASLKATCMLSRSTQLIPWRIELLVKFRTSPGTCFTLKVLSQSPSCPILQETRAGLCPSSVSPRRLRGSLEPDSPA